MAYRVRKTTDAMVFAIVAQQNARQQASVASFFHADITQKPGGSYQAPTVTNDTITAANASDLATSVTLANNCKAVINRHFADDYAHDSAVSAQVATADATDLATGITLANALKAAYNTHRAAASVHFTNDGANATAATDATDQSSLNTLLNEIKTDFNAHVISAPIGSMIRLVPA